MRSSCERWRWPELSLAVFVSAALCGQAVPEEGASATTPVAAGEQVATESSRIDEEGDVKGVHREVLFVEGSSPWIPTANSIATKLPVELARTPAHVGVISGPLMAERGGRVVGDALESVSGINVQPGLGVFDFFVLRGFDSLSSALVLTDGTPEPEGTFFHLYNAERVEVFKGPAGFLYGSHPLAGAVNIVRKQPEPTGFGVVGASLGSFGSNELRLDLNRAGSSGAVSFRVNGLWQESDGYRDGMSSREAAAFPTLRWRVDEDTALSFSLEAVTSHRVPDGGLPLVNGELPAVPRRRSYGSPFDDSEQDAVRFQADFETALASSVRLRNKLYVRDLAWTSAGTLLGGVFPDGYGGMAVQRTLLLLDDRRELHGNQLELLISADTGGVHHELVSGLEIARLDDVYALDVALLPFIDLLDPVETAREPLFELPDQSASGDSRTVVAAPYLVDQISVTPRLGLLLGARLDVMDFEDVVTGTDRHDQEVSAFAGALFSPVPGRAVFVNGARSFAPPSPRVVGERVPESSWQLEVGGRAELFDGRARVVAALFQLERENIAIPDDNGFTQQVGDQRARGGELEIAAQLRRGWHAFLAYAYTDSRLTRFAERVTVGYPPTFSTIDRSGNRSAFSPEHLVDLWVGAPLGRRVDLALGARFVSEQFLAEENAAALDSQLLLNGVVSWSVGDYRISVRANNLTDERHELRGYGASSVTPGEPRSARVELEYRF